MEQNLIKRSNAELINGLIGMDLNTLSAIGKRSNAELINGLLGMNLNKLSSAGRRWSLKMATGAFPSLWIFCQKSDLCSLALLSYK